jgi:2,3-bisphosphoglycerate-independent phosphoglycerate mutase
MIFIDGIGFGKADNSTNPFFKYPFKTFNNIFGKTPSIDEQYIEKEGKYIFPADSLLGVEGLPQSGTGQTSIFCGINAAKLIGKHFGPYPYSTLIPIIKESNIFTDLLRKGRKVYFMNSYPRVFFDYINSGKNRLSVTTMSSQFSGLKLNRVIEVRRGKGLTAEITNERWNSKLGYRLPVISPVTAAKRLLKIAADYHFTLFEYFLTDHIGHGRYDGDVSHCLSTLDTFLYEILVRMDNKKTSFIICSDHGNMEDISIKTHTLNPAITLTSGRGAKELMHNIKSLPDIKPCILSLLE